VRPVAVAVEDSQGNIQADYVCPRTGVLIGDTPNQKIAVFIFIKGLKKYVDRRTGPVCPWMGVAEGRDAARVIKIARKRLSGLRSLLDTGIAISFSCFPWDMFQS
jgi:hypothetical protein